MFPSFNEMMRGQKLKFFIESKLKKMDKRLLKEEETYSKFKMIVLEMKEVIAKKKGRKEVVATFECSGRIEMTYALTITS